MGIVFTSRTLRAGLFLLLAALAAFPVIASAQTADEVIGKYLAARGGLEKIKKVQSERVSGTISFGPGAEGPFVVERKRPMKMHMEITVAGKTLIRSYDGKGSGWVYNPFGPNPAVVPMSAADMKGIEDEADFEGPFVDYKAKGNKIEYVGKEDVEGKPAYKIKLTSKQGETSYFLFDVGTNLICKWEGTRRVGDKDVPWESYFRDFREQDGLKYPFLIESDAPGSDQIQKIAANQIEVNVALSETDFGKPTRPAEPTPTQAPADPAKP
jgi:outer membrane lipoprotein-sorting protein